MTHEGENTHQAETHYQRFCIAVIGMNGVGKSHFGKNLASKLRMKRIDTDTEFRKIYGKEQEYIDAHGCEAFRKMEEEIVCRSLLPNHIVVLSGGAIESAVIRAALQKRAIVLWIQAGHKRTHKNLKRANVERPEFKHGVSTGAVKTLLNLRNPLYEETADIALLPHIRFAEQVSVAIRLLRGFITDKQPHRL